MRVPGLCQGDGWTPLLVACLRGHVEVVRALLASGAAVDQARVRAPIREPGVLCVCVFFFWGGEGLHSHYAISLSAPTSLVTTTPVMAACRFKVPTQCLAEMRHARGVSMTYPLPTQSDGTTPLFIASELGNVDCVRLLLGAGAVANLAKVCGGLLISVKTGSLYIQYQELSRGCCTGVGILRACTGPAFWQCVCECRAVCRVMGPRRCTSPARRGVRNV